MRDATDLIDASVFVGKLSFLHLNNIGFTSHIIELIAVLRSMSTLPNIILMNETFLIRSTENIEFEGYSCVARRDRRDGSKCGGTAVFGEIEIAERVALAMYSPAAGRRWLHAHCAQGRPLVCAWYRPPPPPTPAPGELNSRVTFEAEFLELQLDSIGTIVIGDLNVHQPSWLLYSSHNTPEGSKLGEVRRERGLFDHVRQPTRNNYLLDLVLSNMVNVSTSVFFFQGICDHSLVLVRLNFSVLDTVAIQRDVWNFRSADWNELTEMLHL